jgi:hypothetical protein
LDEARDLLLEQAEQLEVCQTARERQAGEIIMLKAEIERLKTLPAGDCEPVGNKWVIQLFGITCRKKGVSG